MGDFVQWLEDELRARGWSRSEAARRGGISASMVDKVINRYANPGVDFCRGIAQAFGLSEVEVLQRAGVIKALPDSVRQAIESDDDLRHWVEIMRDLSYEERRNVIRYARFVREQHGGAKRDNEEQDR